MENWTLDETGFEVTYPYQYRPWVNFLSNPDYGMRISHLGDGYSTTIKEPRRVITNYDFFTPNKGRYVFVKDGDCVWSPSFYPVKTDLDKYSCKHAPGYTRFLSEHQGIEVESLNFLPLYGAFEVWKVKAKNNTNETKKISIFPQVEYHLYNTMTVDPIYYSWFTNSEYREDENTIGFFKTDSEAVYGFFRSITKPDAFESSLRRFTGDGDIQMPEAVKKGQLLNSISGGDPYIGAFQFDMELAPGEEQEMAFFVGEGKDTFELTKKGFNTIADVDKELEVVKEHWAKKLHREEFDHVSDPIFKAYLQTFFPYQIYQQAEGLVRSTWRGFRDVAQDAMGLSYFNPEGARELIVTYNSKQYKNGRCLRQWNTEGVGANDERDFHDLPLWAPVSVAKYIDNTGDSDILSVKVPWEDSEEESTIYDHMVQGLKYVLTYGPNELLHIGIGDWNDALSGLGLKGESLWLNQIAYLALAKMKEFNEKYGFSCDIDIDAEMERLYQGVIKNWTGEWFSRGFHEDGTEVGGKDRIFLLPQAWFTISGMSERDPEKAKIALDNMVAKLRNDDGLLICHPGFEKYDEVVGNLSALAPGMAENFAIYNHASGFGIYALLMADRKDEAVEFLKKLIPIYKDLHRTQAEPYVLVNYYNGGYYDYKGGEGGIPWLTGTVAWVALSFFDQIVPKGISLED